ncbi:MULTISPECIES: DUF2510 domain-containing protein [unclassified Streptomyces]|uniref:DUF2510 domain-containing protein n=1 Tax=unclassified Streptomyces TaxID=2593676 RepID=UPI002741A140|nr:MULTISPECIES: DUF2510 domain-containing protein [unclassified Streptomyces]
MTPPPGWYRDPSAPHLERWWDGTAWTDHQRAPEAPQPQPQAQPSPAPAPPPPAGGGPTRAKAVALTTAGAVLVAAIVTGAVVLGRDDGGGTGARTAASDTSATAAGPSTAATSPSPSSAAPSATATGDPSVAVDQLNGITLPVPDGWEKPQYVADDNVVMTTHGTYDCPTRTGLCRHGLVLTLTATATDAAPPKALAEQDIENAADLAYDENAAGQRLYGGITSHRAVASGQIAVAGRAGYFVRWRVSTAQGPGGYVESLVFPSSVGSEAPVVVRFVLDAGADGPPLSDIDRITKGIRPLGDAGTSGGVGSSIGPAG